MSAWSRMTPREQEEENQLLAQHAAAMASAQPRLETYPAQEEAGNEPSGGQMADLQEQLRSALGVAEELPAKIRGNAWGGVRPYHIEVKPTPAPGMPGGRTWSIKQIMEGK